VKIGKNERDPLLFTGKLLRFSECFEILSAAYQ
jgi:hypothetical protein